MIERLVIAPHVDDDVIGCGGILDEKTLTYYCGVDVFHQVDRKKRQLEAMRVLNHTRGRAIFPNAPSITNGLVTMESYITDREVNNYDLESLIHDFETLLFEEKPLEVFLPWPSYNQDHRTVYEAAMVALRPHDHIPFVPRVLLYEEPDCFWPMVGNPFVPNHYREIDIDRKLELYSMMPSQIRGMRSPAHIQMLAGVRGAACNQTFAEAYHILRWCQ